MGKQLLLTLSFGLSVSLIIAQTSCGIFTQVANNPNGVFTTAIKSEGSLWAWGSNSDAQLGDGSTTNRSTPTQIGPATNWATIAGGGIHTLAIKTDGTLWGWGSNGDGQLGDGTTTSKTTPTQIGSANNWAKVATGYHTLAIKTDGTLWAWGFNEDGQLGDGTTTQRNNPVQIGTANNWAAIAVGAYHSVAIKTDGTLWAWGYNGDGQLGDGTTSSKKVPVQIGTATNWGSITCGQFHTAAIKTNGTLWAWGYNSNGRLGDGTTTQKTSPVQIGTATDWSRIAGGGNHTVAIKTDGTLWAWGNNSYGQLGDGTTTQKTSPVQIGTATNWAAIAAGCYHTAAIKTDGALWAWGRNNNRQVGDGTTTQRNSPTQISTNTAVTLATANTSQTLPISTITAFFNAPGCNNLIAFVTPAGGAPINGTTTAKVWIEGVQPAQYVRRHYEITPATNAAVATGKIILYFTQADFNAFNLVSAIKLPTGPSDGSGKANLLIEKRPGVSSDGSGLPDTYTSGIAETINPADGDIVWNAAVDRWEVSFDVTGFSGFFVKTISGILPLRWLSVSGNINTQKQVEVSWKVEEQQVRNYEVEKSIDGRSFSSITSISSKGNGTNDYQYTDVIHPGSVAYYRIKQTDFDGNISYSSVIRLSGQAGSALSVYPSPFADGFTVVTTRAQTAQLVTNQGQLVRIVKLNAGSNYVSAPLLNSGIYLLKTDDGIVRKLVKQ
ncbi:MAG: T9SS type A sorting domain-containing protein [Chitinophagaceae bacterium]|nr:T9SS type A sorting domain-containing protein [Chitinophagaceae bacterium]